MSTTSIRVSLELKGKLEAMKRHPKESLNAVLERILEDVRTLDEKTIDEIEVAASGIRAGRYFTSAQVRRALDL
jgi:predicted transcriptional regulator